MMVVQVVSHVQSTVRCLNYCLSSKAAVYYSGLEFKAYNYTYRA